MLVFYVLQFDKIKLYILLIYHILFFIWLIYCKVFLFVVEMAKMKIKELVENVKRFLAQNITMKTMNNYVKEVNLHSVPNAEDLFVTTPTD